MANCNKENKEGAKFCKFCGEKIEQKPSFIFCDECGAKHEQGTLFCDECGAKIGEEKTSDPWSEFDKPKNDDPWASFADYKEPETIVVEKPIEVVVEKVIEKPVEVVKEIFEQQKEQTDEQKCQQGIDFMGQNKFQQAVDFLLPLAENGNVEAQYNLAVCYDSFKGKNNSANKKKWLKKAAGRHHLKALDLLAQQYATTDSLLKEFKNYFCIGADFGLASCQYAYAKALEREEKAGNHDWILGKETRLTWKWKETLIIENLQKAAKKGHANAFCELSIIYGQGLYGEKQNLVKWEEYVDKAYDLGSGQAAYEIACAYFYGSHGIDINYNEAKKYFITAVDRGDDFSKKILKAWDKCVKNKSLFSAI